MGCRKMTSSTVLDLEPRTWFAVVRSRMEFLSYTLHDAIGYTMEQSQETTSLPLSPKLGNVRVTYISAEVPDVGPKSQISCWFRGSSIANLSSTSFLLLVPHPCFLSCKPPVSSRFK